MLDERYETPRKPGAANIASPSIPRFLNAACRVVQARISSGRQGGGMRTALIVAALTLAPALSAAGAQSVSVNISASVQFPAVTQLSLIHI